MFLFIAESIQSITHKILFNNTNSSSCQRRFRQTFQGDIQILGYIWLLYALVIAILPLILVGIYARLRFKADFFTILGTLSGSMTNPIALNYANSLAGSDMPAISYATVYPLAMFLRVVIAQLMILFLI